MDSESDLSFPARLLHLAQLEIDQMNAQLPEPVHTAAQQCSVIFESFLRSHQQNPDLPVDILGSFDGCSRLDPEPELPEDMPRIRLFLDQLWKHSAQDEQIFRREVRVTYLYELGHYLGWGEEEIEALGLG